MRTYGAKALTFDSDKLPALSGIAKQIQWRLPQSLSQYLAGLWGVNLVYCLSSHVRDEPNSAQRYRAPSWVCAPVSGGVTYAELHIPKIQARVLAVECSLAGTDTTGAVFGGHLTICEPLIIVQLIYNNGPGLNGGDQYRFRMSNALGSLSEKRDSPLPMILNDYDYEQEGNSCICTRETLWLLHMGKADAPIDIPDYHGLGLRSPQNLKAPAGEPYIRKSWALLG